MSKRVAIYTSNRAISLQKVAQHIGYVLEDCGDCKVTYVFSPNLDPTLFERHDAAIVMMPFDVIWVLPYFYIAWRYWYSGKRYVFYTTIEGSVLKEAVRAWIIRDLDFISVSSYVERKLLQAGARVKEVIHHGVDVQSILQTSERGIYLRKKLGLEDKIVVGYIASGHRRKCHDLFSQTVRILEKDNRFKFIILTDDRGAKYYRDTNAIVISSFGELSDEEVYSLYHLIDIYAHGAGSEGFGLPVAEALAAGKLVVIPNYQPLIEFTPPDLSVKVAVKDHLKYDEGGGIIYDLHLYDPSEMADKIIEAVEKLRKRDFSEDSFNTFRCNYSIHAKYKRIAELI